MRAVLQRVTQAQVQVVGETGGEETVGAIGRGLLVLLGVEQGDSQQDAALLAKKTAELRLFEDAAGKMNLSLQEVGGGILLVSQFTLYGNCRKGMRPSFIGSAPPEAARRLYGEFGRLLRQEWPTVAEGEFGAMMQVSLINDGPVTLIIDRDAAPKAGTDA